MALDTITVIAVAAFVAGMSGAFLLVAGPRLRPASPTLIWGVSNIFTALGITLFLQGGKPDIAFLVLVAASALTWVAIARFNGRAAPLPALLGGGAVWAIVASGVIVPFDFGAKAGILMTLSAVYLGGTAFELWRGRFERLPARWPMLALVLTNAVGAIVAATQFGRATGVPVLPPGGAAWLAYVIPVIFSVGTAVFLVAMTKERALAKQQLAALTDSLTGLANRGALMEQGSAALQAGLDAGRPVALVLFDLDRFKSVNDTFGHRAGDEVLKRFAASAQGCIRPTDVIGRVGGEEFVAVLAGAGTEAALGFADRVRARFGGDSVAIDGQAVHATVSSGVAVAEPRRAAPSFEELLDRADRALYAAKAAGRDRVSLSGEGVPAPPPIAASLRPAMAAVRAIR